MNMDFFGVSIGKLRIGRNVKLWKIRIVKIRDFYQMIQSQWEQCSVISDSRFCVEISNHILDEQLWDYKYKL